LSEASAIRTRNAGAGQHPFEAVAISGFSSSGAEPPMSTSASEKPWKDTACAKPRCMMLFSSGKLPS
jgi:hypothetical protein